MARKSSSRQQSSSTSSRSGGPGGRRDRKGAPGAGRRKSCPYCRDKVDVVDYKDFGGIRRQLSEKGKIRSARVTGCCRRHQRQLARAVKRARELGLLPYVSLYVASEMATAANLRIPASSVRNGQSPVSSLRPWTARFSPL